MAISPASLDNLDFVWDENAGKDPSHQVVARDFLDYLEFLDEIRPAKSVKKDNSLTWDKVFVL